MAVGGFDIAPMRGPLSSYDNGVTAYRADREAPPGKKVCGIYVFVLSTALVFGIVLLTIAPGMQKCECVVPCGPPPPPPPADSQLDFPGAPPGPLSPGGFALAGFLGMSRQNVLQAASLVMIAFFSLILSTVSSAYVVTFKPGMVQADFEEKGTLSNVSQDVSKPRGRMFAVMLFIASLLSMVSMYTAHIYPNWVQWTSPVTHFSADFQSRTEKNWRILWATIPNVGLMYTALLPSLSNNSGMAKVLTMVHNIAAPLGLAFALIMETVQVSWGENAFAMFFCGDEWASYAGPINVYQRIRVIVCCCTWIAILIFLSVQVYFGLGDVLGIRIRTFYSLALVSFYAEITSMILVFCMPAIQGFSIALYLFDTSVLQDAFYLSMGINAYNNATHPNVPPTYVITA